MQQTERMIKRILNGNYHEINIKQPESNELCRVCGHGEWWHSVKIETLQACRYGRDNSTCAPSTASSENVSILIPADKPVNEECSCMDFVPTENLKWLEHTMKRKNK